MIDAARATARPSILHIGAVSPIDISEEVER